MLAIKFWVVFFFVLKEDKEYILELIFLFISPIILVTVMEKRLLAY